MVSGTCFVPEERLGIVILTNQDNQSFFELLRYHLLDLYCGVTPIPGRLSEPLKFAKEDMQAQLDTIAKWRAQVKRSAMLKMLPPQPPVGTYTNAQYGTITVSQIPKTLTYEVRYQHHSQLKAKLSWMGGNQWLTEYNIVEYGVFPAMLATSETGKPSLTLRVNDFLEIDPYTFEFVK
jgi:hypothetical protein